MGTYRHSVVHSRHMEPNAMMHIQLTPATIKMTNTTQKNSVVSTSIGTPKAVLNSKGTKSSSKNARFNSKQPLITMNTKFQKQTNTKSPSLQNY